MNGSYSLPQQPSQPSGRRSTPDLFAGNGPRPGPSTSTSTIPEAAGPAPCRTSPGKTSSARKQTPFVACILCRRCKAKCIRSDPQAAQCDRCRITGCVCETQTHKRGRPRVRGKDLPRAQPAESSSTSLPPQPSPAPMPFASPSRLPFSVSPHRTALTLELGDQDEESDEDMRDGAGVEHMPLITGGQRSLSLHHLLHPAPEPAESSMRHAGGQGKRDQQVEDIVTKGGISLEIAQTLFYFFFNTLNPVILLFDSELHTFEYIRSRSIFLFTSILASAAVFIAPVFSSRLARELGELSVQAILGVKRSVEVVQAWMIIYFWKDPRDTRAWTYVGLLCRTAVEIGLDRTPIQDEPGMTDVQKRERRNSVRTWMLAFMMDRALASVTGKDWCIRGKDPIIQNCRHLSEHPLRQHGDAVIAGFAELRLISSRVTDELPGRIRVATAEQQHSIARTLLNANFDLDDWHQFWEGETARQQSPSVYMETLRFFELHIRLNLNSHAVNLARSVVDITPDVPLNSEMARAEQHCFHLALDSLAQLRVLFTIDERLLQYAQDSMSIMIAYSASFLRVLVNSPTFTQVERERAITSINDTSQLFRRDPTQAPSGPNAPGHTSAHIQARFLQSLAEQRQAAKPPGERINPFDPVSNVLPQSAIPRGPGAQAHSHGMSELDFGGPSGIGGIPGDLNQATTDLLAWFDQTEPNEFGRADQLPPMGYVSAGISPFMPFSMQDGGMRSQEPLPGLSDLGDQGWDQFLSMWLDVPPYNEAERPN